MPAIERLCLRRLNLPLVRPYRLAYRTFETFEPFVVEVWDSEGGYGFADGHISPGSSAETRDGGWAFLSGAMETSVGKTPEAAKRAVLDRFEDSKVAATAFVSALEVLEKSSLLEIRDDVVLPLLTPINSTDLEAIDPEVEDWLAKGFRTFKVKVGKDVEADLARVNAIQTAIEDRATIRLDANRGFSREAAIAFVSRLDPAGVELFEQPCAAEDWDANAAVAAACPVPLMLDEPICTIADIERAAEIPNVGYCKLKLKRFGGLQRLRDGLDAVSAHGMEPVLGDGLGSEVQAWLEAAIAAKTIQNAGEFNGFLKPMAGLFAEPLPFSDGAIRLPAGYAPKLDCEALSGATVEKQDFH